MAVGFPAGSELLRELAGVTVDREQVERAAERLGAEITTNKRAVSSPSRRRSRRCVSA